MTDFKIGDEEFVDEVNTSYDQDQPIGDTPSAYFGVSGEPINAANGQGYMDRGRLGETLGVSNESLNKDGTGVRRATRGLDPNKTKRKWLRFLYVSKSECEICKEFDGKIYRVDDEDRPCIPRLEEWDGVRPITHPNCKCKWVRTFSQEESLAEEKSLDEKTLARARKWYGDGFDKLSTLEQKLQVIKMLRQSLAEEWDESQHPRGQPSNPGQFVAKGHGSQRSDASKIELASKLTKAYPNLKPEFIEQQIDKAKRLRDNATKVNHRVQTELSTLFPYVKITGRVKEVDSMIGKVGRKPDEYSDVSDLNDISGVRAIAGNIDEVKDIIAEIKNNYTIIEETDNIDQHRGGYRSYHVIVNVDGVKNEIQVRTENQDLWANWCHDTFYKPSSSLLEFVNTNKEAITQYTIAMSDYLYNKDKGFEVQKPECPEVIHTTLGCMA